MSSFIEQAKIALALRTARSALGWSQEEAADKLSIAKSTLARAETMESMVTADLLARIFRLYYEHGVRADYMYGDDVTVNISKDAVVALENRLLENLGKKMSTGSSADSPKRKPGRPRKSPID